VAATVRAVCVVGDAGVAVSVMLWKIAVRLQNVCVVLVAGFFFNIEEIIYNGPSPLGMTRVIFSANEGAELPATSADESSKPMDIINTPRQKI
jgi:hypothetical protein